MSSQTDAERDTPSEETSDKLYESGVFFTYRGMVCRAYVEKEQTGNVSMERTAGAELIGVEVSSVPPSVETSDTHVASLSGQAVEYVPHEQVPGLSASDGGPKSFHKTVVCQTQTGATYSRKFAENMAGNPIGICIISLRILLGRSESVAEQVDGAVSRLTDTIDTIVEEQLVGPDVSDVVEGVSRNVVDDIGAGSVVSKPPGDIAEDSVDLELALESEQ